MTSFTKLAAMTFAALLLTTSFASAGGVWADFDVSDSGDDNSMVDIIEDIGSDGDHDSVDLRPGLSRDPEIKINKDIVDAMGGVKTPQVEFRDLGLSGKKARGQQQQKAGNLILDCSLGGADLLIANAGTVGIPAGTKLKWSIRSYGAQGYVQLKQGLEAGADVRVAAVLDGAATEGTACAVKVAGL